MMFEYFLNLFILFVRTRTGRGDRRPAFAIPHLALFHLTTSTSRSARRGEPAMSDIAPADLAAGVPGLDVTQAANTVVLLLSFCGIFLMQVSLRSVLAPVVLLCC
jgi:hypothetical protein